MKAGRPSVDWQPRIAHDKKKDLAELSFPEL